MKLWPGSLFGRLALVLIGTLAVAVVAGWVIGRLGMELHLEAWVRDMPRTTATLPLDEITTAERIDAGLAAVREIVGRVWAYLLIGIGLGACIHGFVPEQFMASFMGKDVWSAVPLAVAVGVPMYANAAGVIPVVQALLAKGAALGTVLAFMMSVIAYRNLGGGVTTVNVLHGSCNAIGGQNAVLKLRRGKAPEDLLFKEAPRGIKFALGENVKRSGFRVPGQEPRHPGSRMGIDAVPVREAFLKARAYRREWADYEARAKAAGAKGERPVPPRRDLRLEELADVLDGKVLVYAHAYRADEMLMLMKVADDFGFKVRTFEHGLEAYKIAGEIARHGAGVGTFIDWWAFRTRRRP